MGVEQLEDALAGSHGGLQDVVLLAEVHDGPEEALRVLDEADEDADLDGPEDAGSVGGIEADGVGGGEEGGVVQHGLATAPEDEGDGGGGEEFDDGIVPGVGEDGVGPGALVLGIDGGEVVEGAALAVEELDDGHAGDVLLGEGVDLGGGGALAAVAVAKLARKMRVTKRMQGMTATVSRARGQLFQSMMATMKVRVKRPRRWRVRRR